MLNRNGVQSAVKIKAYREYREASPPKTDDWFRATWQLALLLQKTGDHRKALRLQREYLQADPKASWIMLDAAVSHLALGENDAARRPDPRRGKSDFGKSRATIRQRLRTKGLDSHRPASRSITQAIEITPTTLAVMQSKKRSYCVCCRLHPTA